MYFRSLSKYKKYLEKEYKRIKREDDIIKNILTLTLVGSLFVLLIHLLFFGFEETFAIKLFSLFLGSATLILMVTSLYIDIEKEKIENEYWYYFGKSILNIRGEKND